MMFLSRQLLSLDVVDGDVVSVGRDVAVGTGVDVIKGPVVVRRAAVGREASVCSLHLRSGVPVSVSPVLHVKFESAQRRRMLVWYVSVLNLQTIYNIYYDFIPTLFLILIG